MASTDDPNVGDTVTCNRLQSPFPGINIWLPSNGARLDEGNDLAKRPAAAEVEDSATPSLFQKMRNRWMRSNQSAEARRAATSMMAKRAKVSSVNKPGASPAIRLAESERQYLEYLKRSVGEGQFSHYFAPAQ